jgi:hypothetical protein
MLDGDPLATLDLDPYTVFFDNGEGDFGGFATPPTPATGDPRFRALSDDGDWRNDNWRPAAGSALLDAGSPLSPPDVDGSRADLGAFGGPRGDWTP